MSKDFDDKLRIAGCSFSVHPMSDNFADIITSALDEIDTSKVWMQTDQVNTIVRGRIAHIFDVTRAVLVKMARTGEHVAFHATYSVGCPGDTSGHSYMAEDEVPLNASEAEEKSQSVAAKFALYPMGGGDYMDVIYEQIEEMKKKDIEVNLTHYGRRCL